MTYMVNIKQLTENNKPSWSNVIRNDKLDFLPSIDSQTKEPPSNAAKPIDSAKSSIGEPADINSRLIAPNSTAVLNILPSIN